MPLQYHRKCVDRDQLQPVTDMVKQHLSSIASATDDPTEFYDLVEIKNVTENGDIVVWGTLDREVQCDYSLPEGYQPPGEEEYQQGFGTRELDDDQYMEHMIKKASGIRDLQLQAFTLVNQIGGTEYEGVRFSDGTAVLRSVSLTPGQEVKTTILDSVVEVKKHYGNLEVKWK